MFSPGLIREKTTVTSHTQVCNSFSRNPLSIGEPSGAKSLTRLSAEQRANVSPLPVPESEEQQGEQVSNQQQQVEVPIQEEPLRQEAPIDRPLEHKLTAEIKRPAQITDGILQEEGQTQQNLT